MKEVYLVIGKGNVSGGFIIFCACDTLLMAERQQAHFKASDPDLEIIIERKSVLLEEMA